MTKIQDEIFCLRNQAHELNSPLSVTWWNNRNRLLLQYILYFCCQKIYLPLRKEIYFPEAH